MRQHMVGTLLLLVAALLIAASAHTGGASLALQGGDNAPYKIVAYWDDGTTAEYLLATPPPHATPTPTDTATPTSTPTLTPTNTPRPTATDTPAPSATPTPETGTAVPTPHETPPPPVTECFATVRVTGLNVRSNPSVDGVRYGALAGPARVPVSMVFVRFNEASPYREEWGAIEYEGRPAWIALWYRGGELARLDDTPACWDIATYDEDDTTLHLGWHAVIPNIDYNDMRASFDVWAGQGVPVSAKGTEDTTSAAMAVSYGGIGIYRTVRVDGDCWTDFNVVPEVAARARAVNQMAVMPPPSTGIWAEGDNECRLYFEDAPPGWLDRYYAAQIKVFSETGYTYVFGTQLAGDWTEPRVKALSATWDAALEHGACLGIHAGSPIAGYYAVAGMVHPWLWPYTFQHREIRRWLVELDPAYVRIPFCATEWASGGGWAPFEPQDYISWAREVRYDGVLMMAGWTAGDWVSGHSVNGRMAETARLW